MECRLINDICEYLINNKGLFEKTSRVIIQKVIFLSVYGKKRIEKIEPEVCAKMCGPYINKVANVYKTGMIDMIDMVDMLGNKKEILPDKIKSIVDEYYTLVSEVAEKKKY